MNIVAFVYLYVCIEAHTINNNDKTISLWRYSISIYICLHNSLCDTLKSTLCFVAILYFNCLKLMENTKAKPVCEWSILYDETINTIFKNL